jgi:hypothetical protein
MNPSQSDDTPKRPNVRSKDPQAVMDSAKAASAGASHQPPYIVKDPQAVMDSAAAAAGHNPPSIVKDPQAVVESAAAATAGQKPHYIAKDTQAVLDSAAAAAGHKPPFIVKDPQAVMDSAKAARSGSGPSTAGNEQKTSTGLSGMSFKYTYPSTPSRAFHLSFSESEVFFTIPPHMEGGKLWIARPYLARDLREEGPLYMVHWLTADEKRHMTLAIDMLRATVSVSGIVEGREMFDTANLDEVFRGGKNAVWNLPEKH